ncbi:MAG: electron transfer flavoprotein subunit alpha [Acidobacteria bacterium 13_1_40CM_2_64_6]|nr:MAG: electron transfer flavoprotein subunit alpha [Acidobacteria bacterium 13_1_40CM_65_14]OLD56890.1 MAG: electron transfer flavoprotein subunit alpha [Acidobacteria bacterium 13_1_40CM_2_64_6]OLE82375.1 MAG: electron transfer flavoprotein subunit alpha [Acidobacteria bacterium 13_1_20CM_2_65_9]
MILVVAEQRDGKLNRATWETIVGAQQLASASNVPIAVLVPGAGAGSVANELAAAQVKEIVTVEHAALEPYTPDGYTAALQDAIGQLSATYVLLPHTYQTRDFAPKLAARLDRAIITDVTAIKPGSETAFVRPMFQGKLTADVVPLGPGPHFVTFQIGAFRVDQVAKGASPAAVRALDVNVDASAIRQTPEAPFQQAKQAVDLSQAERIVSVGRGIKEQTNIEVAKKLAEALGAEIAASRPICDAGWLPMERQVGSSGQTVAPKLYVALGISGAIQHLVGMKGANTIVAINKDPDAPIFEIADYGIVGDLFEIVPAMVAALQK